MYSIKADPDGNPGDVAVVEREIHSNYYQAGMENGVTSVVQSDRDVVANENQHYSCMQQNFTDLAKRDETYNYANRSKYEFIRAKAVNKHNQVVGMYNVCYPQRVVRSSSRVAAVQLAKIPQRDIEHRNRQCIQFPKVANELPKPTFVELIYNALLSFPGETATTVNILSWIAENFPHYTYFGWENSVRHTLSVKPYFLKKKMEIEGRRPVWFWSYEPFYNTKGIRILDIPRQSRVEAITKYIFKQEKYENIYLMHDIFHELLTRQEHDPFRYSKCS